MGSARRLTILGSTGSIGRSTLDVVEHHSEHFEVVGLVAGRRVEALAEQVRRHRPQHVAVADEASARALAALLDGQPKPEIAVGEKGAAEVASNGADVVVAAIVGAVGLLPTLAAVRAGRTVGLANKEALVVSGALMRAEAERSGALLLPIDSEHNAIHQCLRAGGEREVARLVLTASGGPFRGRRREELGGVTREEALDHPTWDMGPKITVDSATLMNKGLEVIEAHWLFGFAPARIDVLVHPQSIVHSMVEFVDGSVIAQLGNPDMCHPIQYALTWPERWPGHVERLDLARIGSLSFETPDCEAFRCLELAYAALRAGGDAPARLNAANEVAVSAFLEGRLDFLGIGETIAEVLERAPAGPADSLEAVLEADRRARESATRIVASRKTAS